ncbi:hypothetical protein PV04_00547 [Phialophora macrospora]|uniref:Uncharacterized protein n=1 Tax=Phialophora macrospora TaxID=1851006 RepID=A0A0D2FV44_9EURO|nr:hypothetical protein PV04_00547 [Phialophora macrospora]
MAETIPQPAPLAETVLGQQIQDVARQVRNEILAPLNGVDYRYHHPPAGTHADGLSRRFWTLYTQRDANDVISHIIRTNIEVLRVVEVRLDDLYRDLKKRAIALIHLSTLPATDRGFLRGEVARTRTAMEGHERWVGVLASEVHLSKVALQRVDAAREVIGMRHCLARGELSPWEMHYLQEVPLAVYQAMRAEVVRAATEVYEMTGNADFLERHKNELWDVVARPVE